ncbi:hypothetical protein SPD48_06955 [Pseudogracilibacillus sp. SE30717A]|uniref:hypothetical protein n=1 Tax=Pseudogracilibacillus sp. SE30717A TaxID=3098293 RepID=UPI00300DE124
MKRILILFLSVSISILFITACSDKNGTKNASNETNNQSEERLENEEDNQIEDDKNDDKDEDEWEIIGSGHQKGLKIGETGTVISGVLDENDRYEITLNDFQSVEEEEVEGERIYNEIFLKANVTIKNIDEKAFSLDSIFEPTVGDEDLDDIELFPAFRVDFFQDDKGTPMENQMIEPGETVIADYYFDTEQADLYRFAFGNSMDQIVKFAQWNISKDEM